MSKKFAFVLMSFDKRFEDIYKFGIKAACEKLDIRCERLDEQIYNENMVQRIYDQISIADFVIADTSRDKKRRFNPNVFYEAGYARAKDKTLIPLTQDTRNLPFDMAQYRHVVYSSKRLSALKKALVEVLTWQLDTLNDKEEIEIARKISRLKIYLNGIYLDKDKVNQIQISIPLKSFDNPTHTFSVPVNLLIKNSSKSENIVLPTCYQHFVVPDNLLVSADDNELVSLSENKNSISIGEHLSVWKDAHMEAAWKWEFYPPIAVMKKNPIAIEYHCQMFKYDIELIFSTANNML